MESVNKINVENITKTDIIEALSQQPTQPILKLDETIEDLKKMGIRDINEIDNKQIMDEILKNTQITKTLEDISRNSKDSKSIREYLEDHIKFLQSISPNKSFGDIIRKIDIEHAKAILKTTDKQDVADNIIKKHLKTLRKKYK